MRVVSLAVLLALGLVGCKGGSTMDDGKASKNTNGTNPVDEKNIPEYLTSFRDSLGVTPKCDTKAEANNTLLSYLKASYYWTAALPQTLDNSYDNLSIAQSMRKIRNSNAQDRFSFAYDLATYNHSVVNGNSTGYGIEFEMSSDMQSFYVRFAFPRSPASLNGLTRGSRVTKIDDESIPAILAELRRTYSSYTDAEAALYIRDLYLGKKDSANFTWIDGNNEEKNATIAKSVVNRDSVLFSEVKEVAGKKVGYLVFNEFVEKSAHELDAAFTKFKNEGVTQVILDLRYNGGGLINIANQLATQILGTDIENQVFSRYQYNSALENKYKDEDKEYKFNANGKAALSGVTDLTVLTTEDSCSSSELVINAIKAYPAEINITTIGGKTCGKPLFMLSQYMCGHVVYAINGLILDKNGHQDYLNKGISPSCSVTDQYTGKWGETGKDAILDAAISKLETGSCGRFRRGSEERQVISTAQPRFAIATRDFVQ